MPERKLTVFLVDDESIIRNGMKKLFDWESNGFTITGEAENGRDALPLILSLKPDIIITDLKMPFCDGITLASEIKKPCRRQRRLFSQAMMNLNLQSKQ